MLKKTISDFFIIKLFSNVNEWVKLKMVKYNKNLQKKIDISLINYKIFSGRYIIYETNVIGKEYNGYNDKLYFVGEYINGERNGKGKEEKEKEEKEKIETLKNIMMMVNYYLKENI